MTFKEFKKIVLDYFSKKYSIKKRYLKKIIIIDFDNCGEPEAKFTAIKNKKTTNLTLEYRDISENYKWRLINENKNTICNLAPTIEECCDFIKNKGYDLCKN